MSAPGRVEIDYPELAWSEKRGGQVVVGQLHHIVGWIEQTGPGPDPGLTIRQQTGHKRRKEEKEEKRSWSDHCAALTINDQVGRWSENIDQQLAS